MDSAILYDNTKFTNDENNIIEKNKNFFSSDDKYIETMLSIIDGTSHISTRVIEFFVTNYSKKNSTVYKIKNQGKIELFLVNSEYKNKLKTFSKDYFDPFCRQKKIYYTHIKSNKESITFITSIGQLNFFKWAISSKIIKYIEMKIDEIREEMKTIMKNNDKRKKNLLSQNKTVNLDNISVCSSENARKITISDKNDKSTSENSIKRMSLIKNVKPVRKVNGVIQVSFT
jgi:hypothetical protein